MMGLEAALALRDMGYSYKYLGAGWRRLLGWSDSGWQSFDRLSGPMEGYEYVAAPDHLTALNWLEEEGIVYAWWRDPALHRSEGPWGADLPGRVDPDDDDSDTPVVRADDPDSLILAIAAHEQRRQRIAKDLAQPEGAA